VNLYPLWVLFSLLRTKIIFLYISAGIKSYPQLQGKVEAYNKIVKNEFLAVEDISSRDDGKVRYDLFVKAYNEAREHGGINGLTPSEMFLQRLIKSDTYTKKKQESVTHVGKQNCYLSV
jgi:hypothetical protein